MVASINLERGIAMFGKLKFWGKKEPDFDKDLGLDLGLPPDTGAGPGGDMSSPPGMPGQSDNLGLPAMPQDDFASTQPRQQSFPPEQFSQPQPHYEPVQERPADNITLKNLEVISYKLDAIQAVLNSINQRMDNLEKKEQNKYRY